MARLAQKADGFGRAPERLFCGVGAGVYLRGGMTARVSLVPFSDETQECSGGKRQQRRGSLAAAGKADIDIAIASGVCWIKDWLGAAMTRREVGRANDMGSHFGGDMQPVSQIVGTIASQARPPSADATRAGGPGRAASASRISGSRSSRAGEKPRALILA